MNIIATENIAPDFKIKSILSESWKLLKSSKWAILLPFMVACAIMLILIQLPVHLHLIQNPAVFYQQSTAHFFTQQHMIFLIFQLIASIIVAPLLVGATLIGTKRARGESVCYKDGFAYFHRFAPLAAAQCIFFLITTTLSCLFINYMGISMMVSVVLFPFLMLALPLIADKNRGVLPAFQESIRKTSTHWFRILLLPLTLFAIAMLTILCFVLVAALIAGVSYGVAMLNGVMISKTILAAILSPIFLACIITFFIWLIPYWLIVVGVIYHKLAD